MRDGLVSYEAGGSPFPEFRRGQTEVLEVARQAIKEGRLGLDLEFSPATGKAHIIGTASKSLSAGARFSAELCRQIVREASESNAQFVGHSVLDADKPIVEGYLGHETPLTAWDDSMLRGYLCNSDWCSQPGKTEDDDDKGALGLMNLGTMGTYYLGVPLWKRCRDIGCTGPCPEHDEEWYCAVDSWAGLRIADKAREEMTKRNIPEKLYEDLKKLSIYCGDMQRRGVAIDREWVERLEKGIVEKKAELFPSEMKLATPRSKKEKKVWNTPFNPNSPKDIIKWFAENGLPLEAKKGSPTGKDTIRKTLELALKKFRIPYDIDRKSGILEVVEAEADIPEAVDYLLRLDRYKRAGKGLKSWFDDEYFGADGYIHPRFIVTGTATGRLASSGPNFQNIPKRGFGSLVRAAIVPREKGLQLLKSDKLQLEFRIVLFYAGETPPKGDPFSKIVNENLGILDDAAKNMSGKPRDVAKSIVHAGDYLEGLAVVGDMDLAKERIQKEISLGARLVFDGKNGREKWEYRGGYVSFTGANLAERIFGDKSLANRTRALQIQEAYFRTHPGVRRWQQEVSREVERTRAIRSYTGRSLQLYGTPEDDLKLACAFLGQGGGADEVQEAMLRYQAIGHTALLQVHDELVFEAPADWTDSEIKKFFSIFSAPSERFDGREFPVDIQKGMNWCAAGEMNPHGLVEVA